MPNRDYFVDLRWRIADLLCRPCPRPQYERVMLLVAVFRRFDCVLAPMKTKVLAEHEQSKNEFQREALGAHLYKVVGQWFHNRSLLDVKRLKGLEPQ